MGHWSFPCATRIGITAGVGDLHIRRMPVLQDSCEGRVRAMQVRRREWSAITSSIQQH